MANLAAAYITLAFAGWCATMATAGGTCSLKPGQDCSGNDISDAPSASPQACCDACAATAGCGAFTYNDYNAQGQQQGTCYLKSACPSSIGCGTCTAGACSCELGFFGADCSRDARDHTVRLLIADC